MVCKDAFARSSRPKAFSLVEVLVAMAVVALLLGILAQMIGSASDLTTSGQKRMDAEGAGRQALGILANDMTKMVRRPQADLDVVFAKRQGNDRLFFYAEAPGFLSTSDPGQQSPVSLVGYRVGPDWKLERLGKGLRWSGPGESPVFLRITGASAVPSTTLAGAWPGVIGSPPDYNGTSVDYQTISDEVFRLEFCLVDNEGNAFLPTASWRSWADDDLNGVPNLREVRAVIVAIAALDKRSRQIVPDMEVLANALPDPTQAQVESDPAELMAASWKKIVENPGFADSLGIPEKAAANVRIYQRVFLLNNQ